MADNTIPKPAQPVGDTTRDGTWAKVNELPRVTRKYRNPYAPPFHMWPPEVLEAYKTFPKDAEGMNLGIMDRNWPQWRAWALENKDRRHLWPAALHEYIDERKRRESLKERQRAEGSDLPVTSVADRQRP